MARIKPTSLVAGISGKTSKTDNVYFATNTQTGAIYAAKRTKQNATDDPSAAQQDVRNAFATRSKAASAWLTANKPSTTQPDGTTAYQSMLKAYKSQHKIGNTFAYVSKHIDEDGKTPWDE